MKSKFALVANFIIGFFFGAVIGILAAVGFAAFVSRIEFNIDARPSLISRPRTPLVPRIRPGERSARGEVASGL